MLTVQAINSQREKVLYLAPKKSVGICEEVLIIITRGMGDVLSSVDVNAKWDQHFRFSRWENGWGAPRSL